MNATATDGSRFSSCLRITVTRGPCSRHNQMGKTGLPVVPVRQRESIHRWQGSSTSLKFMEGMGKAKTTPVTPEQAVKQYMQKLTAFEHHEIFSYPELYYLGPNAKKHQGMTGGPNNGGYNDDHRVFVQVPHDHVAYMYEILKVIGKGRFWSGCQVLKITKSTSIWP